MKKITLREFKEILESIEEGSYELFCKENRKQNNYSIRGIKNESYPQNILSAYIFWEETIQGYWYWQKIDRVFRAKVKILQQGGDND